MENKSSIFKEKDGKPSMTRVLSFLMFWYFCLSNIVILFNVFQNVNDISMNTLLFILIHDVLVLTAIYAPKQLAKMQEVRELIEVINKK